MDRRSLLTSATALMVGNTLLGCSPSAVTEFVPASLISELSEHILPQTETPGAKAAGVPNYIQRIVAIHFTDEERTAFNRNLSFFDRLAGTKAKNTRFVDLPFVDREKLLSSLDSGSNSIIADWPKPDIASLKRAWQQIKKMTVFGYYTSEAATQELVFEQIPGSYDGCVPFVDIGRAWLDRGA